MQYGDAEESCMVDQAQYLPQGNCKSVIEGLFMANNVHEEDASSHDVGNHRRVFDGLRSHTLDTLAALWRAWSEHRLVRQAVTLSDVKANIVVKRVASPVTSDPWETHETSLMLMECNDPSFTLSSLTVLAASSLARP